MSSITRARIVALAVPLALAIAMAGVTATPAMAREKKNVTIIRSVAKARGVSAADTQALITLAKRESGWNAHERTGTCLGLFQIKTRSKSWADPHFNTNLALKYIKNRYGTPRAALAHSYSHGWY